MKKRHLGRHRRRWPMVRLADARLGHRRGAPCLDADTQWNERAIDREVERMRRRSQPSS